MQKFKSAIVVVTCLIIALFGVVCFSADDALETLNRQRASRGLRPYVRDEGLSLGADSAAAYRAKYCIEGHTNNDFQFLPQGSRASAAGCAAWHWSGEFGACACYENYTYAGAAWYTGKDGRVYMHLFVR